ncbi:MAG: hypothetical protein H7227_05885 [Actinobacteria bacterium]|nr:hypothetical protein [Actinomycetota bacterium]
MNKPRTGIPTRTFVAIVLVIASFISSFVLSRAANRTELLWSAHSVLLPGTVIHPNDLVLRRAALPGGANAYIPQEKLIIGFQILRPVGAGEFIPASAINQDKGGLINIDVPLSVQGSDAPTGLAPGQNVNIYHVESRQPSEKASPPTLVLAGAYILDIDQKSQSMSNSISLTLSIPKVDVVRLLAATDSGRIVVVRLHG